VKKHSSYKGEFYAQTISILLNRSRHGKHVPQALRQCTNERNDTFMNGN